MKGAGGAEEEDRGASPIGQLLCDRWCVVRELGRGGMSTVYEAEDRDGSRVAIKVLHPLLARSPRTRERFLREGRIAVGHEDAVRVLESRQTPDGRLLLVMELLEGQTLEKRCETAGGKLDPSEVLRVADRVLQVLVAAHAKGIFHRDIKPENVFLTSNDEVKVLDFGVAACRDEASQDSSITQSGAALGTPAFMAPEQARGLQAQVDGRTDLWALGATLFYCLTGRHVHEDAATANEAVIFAATQRAPLLRKFRLDLAPELGPVVDRALAFAPADRWSSAHAMREAVIIAAQRLAGLHPVALDIPSSETQDPLEEPPVAPVSPRTRRRSSRFALGAIALCAVGFAIYVELPRAGALTPTGSPSPSPVQPSKLTSGEAIGVPTFAPTNKPSQHDDKLGPAPAPWHEPRRKHRHPETPPGVEVVPDAVLNRRK